MPPEHDRRTFLATLGGLAALANSAGAQAPGQRPAAAPIDINWIDALKGKHKQVYDFGSANLAADPRPLRFAKNFLDTFRDVYKLEGADINTAVGISGPAFPMSGYAPTRRWCRPHGQ